MGGAGSGCLKMAEAAAVRAELCWSRDLSDDERPMVFIPGVSSEGNLRPGSKIKSRRTEEGKLKIPMTAITSVSVDLPSSRGEREQQAFYEGEGMKSASLKDLCLEDKKRIANLIKELARVSEEKEVTEERLKAEQESFEKKIRQMEEQNDLIIKEREALQQQYRECQELLSLYQKYLSEQQEKLNLSISELGAHNSKQQGSTKKSPPQPVPLEFDGSYLGLAGTQTLFKTSTNANPGSAEMFSVSQHCQSDLKTRMTFQSTLQEDRDENPVENGFQKRFNNTTPSSRHREHLANIPDGMDHLVSEYLNVFPHQTEALCCVHSPPRNAEHVLSRCQSEHFPKRQHGTVTDSRGNPEISVLNSRAGPRPRDIGHGKRLPNEKKQVLLLQKMELEIEKERLQQMLAQQEARLLLKQQQLQQSRLDYDRFRGQQATDPVHNEAFMKPGQSSVMNGNCSAQSPLKPECKEYFSRTPASSKTQNRSRGDSSGKKTVEFSAYPETDVLWMHPKDMDRSRKGFRRDAATSPAMVRNTKDLVTTATSPIRPNMSRYDASLLNLVEAMSPISVQRPPPLYTDPFDWTSKNLTPWSQHKPARRPVASALRGRDQEDEEQEESRILEEIFFI